MINTKDLIEMIENLNISKDNMDIKYDISTNKVEKEIEENIIKMLIFLKE